MKSNILKIIIFILAVLIPINLIALYSKSVYVFDEYSISADNLLWNIDNSNYAGLSEDIRTLSEEEIAENSTFTECYHVSEYYKNANFYNVYKDSDPEKAEKYKAKLDVHKSKMGELSYTADEIDSLLFN